MQVLGNHVYCYDILKNNFEMSMTLLLVLNLDHKYFRRIIKPLKYKYGIQQDKSHLNQLLDHIIKGMSNDN